MEKIFSIDETRKFLRALQKEQISMSKFVEILNAKANDKNSVAWLPALTDKPKEGETVICQYKDFNYGEEKYTEATKDNFENLVQCWLHQPYTELEYASQFHKDPIPPTVAAPQEGFCYVEVPVEKEKPKISTYFLCKVIPNEWNTNDEAEVFYDAKAERFLISPNDRFIKVTHWLRRIPISQLPPAPYTPTELGK